MLSIAPRTLRLAGRKGPWAADFLAGDALATGWEVVRRNTPLCMGQEIPFQQCAAGAAGPYPRSLAIRCRLLITNSTRLYCIRTTLS